MRDVLAAAKKLLRENSLDEEPVIREKMDTLKLQMDAVMKINTDRLSQLEQALPLAKHFHDTHNQLQTWFEELEPTLAELEVIPINAEQLKRQQERAKVSLVVFVLCR